MTGLRRAATIACFAFGGAFATPGVGCGTKAVGVDDCRAIEEARCAAAEHCPGMSVDDVEACERFYRDQCLHGLDLEAPPPDSAVNECVAAIEALGRCAESDPALPIAACDDPALAQGHDVELADNVCDLVAKPELAVACVFLGTRPIETGTAGAGGSGGAGGGTLTGGSAPTGGSAATGGSATAGASAAGGAAAGGAAGDAG